MSLVEKIVRPTDGVDSGGWTIKVDGQPIEAKSVDIGRPKSGLYCRWGISPNGYPQFIVEKPGGTTTAVVCEHSEAGVLIGVIGQERPLVYPDAPHTPVATLPGGFLSPGKTAAKGAKKELKEESGLVADPLPTKGPHLHMDRAFIVYGGEVYDDFLYVAVKEEALVKKGVPSIWYKGPAWEFNTELTPNPSEKEKIVAKIEFIPAEVLLNTAIDVYTYAGLAKTLQTLDRINYGPKKS